MQISGPLRAIIEEPLEIPVGDPAAEPEAEPKKKFRQVAFKRG